MKTELVFLPLSSVSMKDETENQGECVIS